MIKIVYVDGMPSNFTLTNHTTKVLMISTADSQSTCTSGSSSRLDGYNLRAGKESQFLIMHDVSQATDNPYNLPCNLHYFPNTSVPTWTFTAILLANGYAIGEFTWFNIGNESMSGIPQYSELAPQAGYKFDVDSDGSLIVSEIQPN